MKKKILVISRFVPYDAVPHAGGKIHNFNIKKLNQEEGFDIKLLSFCTAYDLDKLDHNKYKLDSDIICIDNVEFNTVKNKILNAYYHYIPINTYASFGEYIIKEIIVKKLEEYKRLGYNPDIIMLEWTQIVLFAPLISKIFSNSKLVAIEHDVTFQAFERRFENKKSILEKLVYFIRTQELKKCELKALKKCDSIFTFNEKDKNILKENGICNDIKFIAPYYQNFGAIKNNIEGKNLLFYGKMDRKENYLSCIWFIENVFNDLIQMDNSIKFYIVGYNPTKELLKYQNDNIIITGFVDDPKQYFEQASCLVAPLVLGAGIKIKILEAMYSGVVVLTNDIGIEGIPVTDKQHYFHCSTAKEYKEILTKIFNRDIDVKQVSENAREFLKKNFSITNGYEILRKTLCEL